MKALVKVTYIIDNICSPEDLEATGRNFDEMVEFLIEEEGLSNIASGMSVETIRQLREF